MSPAELQESLGLHIYSHFSDHEMRTFPGQCVGFCPKRNLNIKNADISTLTVNNKLKDTENSPYLVFNWSDVAQGPPVQSTWGIQKVGLQEQGPLARDVSLAAVAVHDLLELLVGLRKGK